MKEGVSLSMADKLQTIAELIEAARRAAIEPRGVDPAPSNASSLRVRMDWILEVRHAPEALHARGNRREAAAS